MAVAMRVMGQASPGVVDVRRGVEGLRFVVGRHRRESDVVDEWRARVRAPEAVSSRRGLSSALLVVGFVVATEDLVSPV